MAFYPGDRVALEHSDEPRLGVRPGDLGTVRRYEPDQRKVEVKWDNGVRVSMLLNEGDRLRRITNPVTVAGRERAFDALREAGSAAGREAAQYWAQQVFGGHTGGDVIAYARHILTGIVDVDPPILDGLPCANRYDRGGDAGRYNEHAPAGATAWNELTARQHDLARWAWCDGYDAAVEAEVARQCRRVLHPDDDRDLSHVHPARLRLGGPGVFAGDWAWTPNQNGDLRIPVGFAGTLVAKWSRWAVFRCTREVAEAIVADHQEHRQRLRRQFAEAGKAAADLHRLVDESLGRLWFDGDVLVADSSQLQDDPDAVYRIGANPEGEYIVMGWAWAWTAVHPYDCDRIVGTIPGPPPTPNAPASVHGEVPDA